VYPAVDNGFSLPTYAESALISADGDLCDCVNFLTLALRLNCRFGCPVAYRRVFDDGSVRSSAHVVDGGVGGVGKRKPS